MRTEKVEYTEATFFFNYGALEMRSFLQKHADNDVGTKLSQGSHSDFEIDSVLIDGKDSLDAPLTVRFRAHSNGDQSRTGDVVSFNPHIIRCIDQNPFVTEYRKYPVDYAYTRKQCSIINVEPPDNYVLQDTVPSRNITLEPNLALYSRQFQRIGNHIQIIRTFEIPGITGTSGNFIRALSIPNRNSSFMPESKNRPFHCTLFLLNKKENNENTNSSLLHCFFRAACAIRTNTA